MFRGSEKSAKGLVEQARTAKVYQEEKEKTRAHLCCSFFSLYFFITCKVHLMIFDAEREYIRISHDHILLLEIREEKLL